MTIAEYLMKAVQDDARRAGELDRLLLEARRARKARRQHLAPAAPAGTEPELGKIVVSEFGEGLRIGRFNWRGITPRSRVDGGTQERALGAQCRAWVARVSDRWPTTGALLRWGSRPR